MYVWRSATMKLFLSPAEYALKAYSIRQTFASYLINELRSTQGDVVNMDEVRINASYDATDNKYLATYGSDTVRAPQPTDVKAGYTLLLSTTPTNSPLSLLLVKRGCTTDHVEIRQFDGITVIVVQQSKCTAPYIVLYGTCIQHTEQH